MKKVIKILILLIIILFIACIYLYKTKNVNTFKIENYLNTTLDKYFETVNLYKNEKYYIPYNLKRYIDYNDGSKSITEIISSVNRNIDNEFYVDIKPTDLSKNSLILVNKFNYLDEDFEPQNKKLLKINKYSYWDGAYLESEAYVAFVKMVDDASLLGYKLIDTSPFRKYSSQERLYNNYVKNNGLAAAEKSSARPGFSEHQTGLATDIVKNGVSMYDFYKTDEFIWLKENAYKYGFILRYPEGKEYLTGYKYEPWHYRYVGLEVAKYIHENDIVFEEYYAYFCEYKGEC